MYTPSPMTIGQRVRLFRDWREMTLVETAGLAGMSKSWLSSVENGETPLYQAKHIDALAAALQISPSDLTGVSTASDAGTSVTRTRIDAVRGALMATEIGKRPRIDGDLRAVEDLTSEADAVALDLYMMGEYERATAILPGLITHLHAHLAVGTDPGAVRALTMACASASAVVRNLGHPDLGWIAAERARRVAELTGRPALLGYADFYVAHALEPYSRAYEYARAAVDALSPHVTDDLSTGVLGMLTMLVGLGAAVADDVPGAMAQLDEADRLAERTGDAPTMGLWFGPTNAGIWRTAFCVEAGDGGRVRELREVINPEAIPSLSRRSAFWADIGRGLAQDGRDEDAVNALARAEKIAPQRIRNNPMVRDTVSTILTRARRAAGGAVLHGMARRMGVY